MSNQLPEVNITVKFKWTDPNHYEIYVDWDNKDFTEKAILNMLMMPAAEQQKIKWEERKKEINYKWSKLKWWQKLFIGNKYNLK